MIDKYFPPADGLSLQFLSISKSSDDVYLFFFLLWFMLFFRVLPKCSQPNPRSQRIVSRTFTFLAPVFKSVIHFELLLCMWCEGRTRVHVCKYSCPLVPHHCLKRLSFFPNEFPQYFCSKSIRYIFMGLFPDFIDLYRWISKCGLSPSDSYRDPRSQNYFHGNKHYAI